MKIVGIEMTIKVPDYICDEEIEEWIKYKTGYTGCMKSNNPLVDRNLNPLTIWTTIDIGE